MGDQGKCDSPKKLKSLIKIPNVAHLRVQAVSLNLNLAFLRRVFLNQVIHFGINMGDQVRGRSPKEPKSLIEVPYIAHLNVQALSFNVNLFSSP